MIKTLILFIIASINSKNFKENTSEKEIHSFIE